VKSAEIQVGREYVVSLKPRHILIPDTGVTYVERLEQMNAMIERTGRLIQPAQVRKMPSAWQAEYRRLSGAVPRGLESRLYRCQNLSLGSGIFGSHVGTVATVVEKLPKGRVLVEADFREERESLSLLSKEGYSLGFFDPTVPEQADVSEEPVESAYDDQESYDAAMDAWEAEVEAWWEEHHNGGRDQAGTLQAVVHQAAVKFAHTDDLVDRLRQAEEERLVEMRKRLAERSKMYERKRLDERGEEIVDSLIDEILAPENDDDWEALA
jgi:hypothetical protein